MKTSTNLVMIGGFAALAMILCLGPISQVAEAKKEIALTGSAVAWVSSQCENVVEELEAIVQQNAQTLRFNAINYLRYLHLYNSLKVVAQQKVKELKWVGAKAKAFEKVYSSVEDALYVYLQGINSRLSFLESTEGKGNQKGVGYYWRILYETIDYIAHYVSI